MLIYYEYTQSLKPEYMKLVLDEITIEDNLPIGVYWVN
jgi:hypothetical protein